MRKTVRVVSGIQDQSVGKVALLAAMGGKDT